MKLEFTLGRDKYYMNSKLIKDKILQTLLFFSIRFRPLNLNELYLYLYSDKKIDFKTLKDNLLKLVQDKKIVQWGQYYFLKKDKLKINDYQKQFPLIKKNWRKAIFTAKILRFVPFVRMVAVINSLSFNVATSNSDIDLFIITANHRLYTARTLIILVLKFFGLYKNKKNYRGKMCLGFYITEQNLNIEKIALKPYDPYFYFWFVSLTPLWGIKIYEKFIRHNLWIKKYFANFSADKKLQLANDRIITHSVSILWLQKIKEFFFFGCVGDLWERILSNIHIKHTLSLPENHSKNSTTIARKNILKLHADDRRTSYKNEFANELTLRLKR